MNMTALASKASLAAGKALVLGDDTRSFLAVVRSLGRRGIEVHVAPIDFSLPALSSKYISQIHRLPYYTGDGAAWLAAAQALLESQAFDIVIPCDDRFFIPFQLHGKQLSAYSRIANINEDAFQAFYNKTRTRELAASCNVAIAKAAVLRADDDVAVACQELTPPLFLKAASSYYAENLYSRNKVLRFENLESLADHFSKLHIEGEYIVEEQFLGHGLGLGILASDGHIVQAFQYSRVHEPPSGGGSSYRVSMAISPDIHAACARMAAAVKYTGVAMFEFRYNRDTHEWILIEVNGRFWGGLPLAVFAGVDFPYRLFRLLTMNDEASPGTYKVGVYARNLILDFYCLLSELEAFAHRNYWIKTRLIFSRLAEFRHVLSGTEASDTFVLDDIRPGFQELRQFAGNLFRRRIGHRAIAKNLIRESAHRTIGKARSSSWGQLTIAFVCFGNICRSPFAALLFKARLEKIRSPRMGGIQFVVLSAGTYPINGRTSPQTAVASAAKLDVDMSGHRSHFLEEDAVPEVDLIIAFDRTNEELIRARYNTVDAPIVLLGALSQDASDPLEIADPFGKSPAEFDRIYRQIERGVAGLLGLLLAKDR